MVKLKQHRNIPSDYKLKAAAISQTPGGKYYVSILFEYENQVQKIEPKAFLGMDFSMPELDVDSNGNEPCYPKYYRQSEKKSAKEQRKLSKMVKGSENREKQKLIAAGLHGENSEPKKGFSA